MEDPDERYQSVIELVNGVRGYINSKDPSLNPREVLATLLATANISKPDRTTLKNAFESLEHASRQPHQEFLEIFHLLPDSWLPLFARGRPLDFYAILTSYAEALDDKSGGMRYAFADEVTARMIALYKGVDDTPIRVVALRCAMHVAHRLDQHTAQREFGSHLATIQSYDLALPISEMLDKHAPSEILKFDRFPLSRMHAFIQGAMGLVAQKAEAEAPAEEEQEVDRGGTLTSEFNFRLKLVDGSFVMSEWVENAILDLPQANFDEAIDQLEDIQSNDGITDRVNQIVRTHLQGTASESSLVPPIRTLDDLDSFIAFLLHFRRQPIEESQESEANRIARMKEAQIEASLEEFRQRLADQRD